MKTNIKHLTNFSLRLMIKMSLITLLIACGGGSGDGSTAGRQIQSNTDTDTEISPFQQQVSLAGDLYNKTDETEDYALYHIEESTLDTTEQDQLETLIVQAMESIAKFIHIKNVSILINQQSYPSVLDGKVSSISFDESTLAISFADSFVTHNDVNYAIAKAVYLTKRSQLLGINTDLKEALIANALAEQFALDVFELTPPTWLPINDPEALLLQANNLFDDLDSSNYDVNALFYQDNNLGYKIGFQAVNRYILDYPGSSAANLVSFTADKFTTYLNDLPSDALQAQKADHTISIRTSDFPGQESITFIAEQAVNNKGHYFVEGLHKRKMIALTFDDGPTHEFTSQILTILETNNAKATFFWIGENLQNNADLAIQAIAEGHTIANHSWDHPHSPELTPQALWQNQIELTNDLFEEYVGFRPRLFRPPYGEITQEQIDYLATKGIKTLLWSIDTKDWYTQDFYAGYTATTVKDIENTVINNLHEEAIVLMHDGPRDRQNTVDSLQGIIDYYTNQGYEFVTLETLLGIGNKY